MLSTNSNPNTASEILQFQISQIESWSESWGIKFNETNLYTHITFTLHREPCPPLYLNNIQIPVADKGT